jgi:putative membrane protein
MWRIFVGFFDTGGEDALARTVREVEAHTCAEIVVAVRRRSGSYRDANALLGALAAASTLAFGLFSPWPFSLEWIFIDPILAGILVGWGSSYIPALERWFTTPGDRRHRVDVHARSMFVERGVVTTTGRTGVLVYVSLVERAARVIADSGVTAAVPAAEWLAAVEAVEHAARRAKATAVAHAIANLGPLLARYLPRAADDVNELPDEVSVS